MKVLLLDTNHPILKEGLENLGFLCHEDYSSSKKMVEEKIQDYQGIVIRSRFTIDKVFIDKAINLKFIARVGAGLENIDTINVFLKHMSNSITYGFHFNYRF